MGRGLLPHWALGIFMARQEEEVVVRTGTMGRSRREKTVETEAVWGEARAWRGEAEEAAGMAS